MVTPEIPEITPQPAGCSTERHAGRDPLHLPRSRSCSTSANRPHSTSFNAASPNSGSFRQPSTSIDLQEDSCTPAGLSTNSAPCTCGHASQAAAASHSRWSKMRTGIFRRKRPVLIKPLLRQQTPDDNSSTSEHKLISDQNPTPRRPGLAQKYQPKVFDEMIGHELIIRALSNAVQSRRISPLYLFHGPGGTGKTSAAKVFAMALNCESAPHTQPCWACAGCSRSLYTAELCAGNRAAGFDNIRTLLRSTAFVQSFPGYKAFIVDECHSLPDCSWGQLLDMVEQEKDNGLLVFIVIAEDADNVPRAVTSRCQKFSFGKLKSSDIVLKLARIVSREGIEIGGEALRLIAKKVEGDLREAENLLDQLGLMGQKITASMVQQLVGLVPNEKLVHLLEAVLCGDSTEAVRSKKDLITYCVEPRGLVLQLASLITEILPGASRSTTATSQEETSIRCPTRLRNIQPKRLYRALKILIDTEKQLRMSSSNQDTWVTAALLQIASDENSSGSSTSILLPKDVYPAGTLITLAEEKSDLAGKIDSVNINRARPSNSSGIIDPRHHQSKHLIAEQPNDHTGSLDTIIKSMDLEVVWHNILGRMQNKSLEDFLRRQTKLGSLTVSRANAIVHLMFTRSEKTSSIEMFKESISNAMEHALGCPVTINISHEPMQLEVMPRNYVTSSGKQVSEPTLSEQHKTQVDAIPKLSRIQDGRIALQRNGSHKSALHLGNNLRSKVLQNSGHTRSQKIEHVYRGAGDCIPAETPVISSHLRQGSKESTLVDPLMVLSRRESHDKTSITKSTEPRSRFLSISSIPRTDVSVEPYSQDLLFDAAQRGSRNSRIYDDLLKPNQHSPSMNYMELTRSWSCTERFCKRETKVKENLEGVLTNKNALP